APTTKIEEKLVEIWAHTLGIDKEAIGIDHNFFELGGHSLKGTVLISRIHKEFNVRLALGTLFKAPTIRGLSIYIKGAVKDKFAAVEPAEKREYYTLSSAQKRLYVVYRIDPQSTGYNMSLVVVLEGKFSGEKVKDTFRSLMYRHDSLRTSFQVVGGRPVQRVHPGTDVSFEIEYYESAGKDNSDIIANFVRPFDLSQVPPLRVGIIKLEEEKHILMFDTHHIVSDGISHELLMRELVKLYHGEVLPELRLQYKDFSQWQNGEAEAGEIKKQEEYWLNRFKGEIPVLKIPTDYPRPEVMRFEGKSIGFEIPHLQAEALRTLAKQEDVTMFMLMLAVINVFFYKITYQEDVVMGTVIAGRSHTDLENIVGMFVNTLALRNYPKGDMTFADFLREVRKSTLEAFDNQDYQFEDLVEKVMIERDASRNPLFDVLFSFSSQAGNNKDGTETVEEQKESGLKIKSLGDEGKEEFTQTKFDIILSGSDSGDRLTFGILYSTRLFKEEAVNRFITYFNEIVSVLMEKSTVKLKDIQISHSLVIATSDAYDGDDESEFEF
ncbi:MAG: non-ribosomal peptide synthetase, partial [bacterium]|nr:non-ribosomal peptide synthetase [bacterium]